MKKISLARKIITVLIFLIALGVIAPVVVFYSLGYRFDLVKGIFVYSGSIVFKATPAEVNIKLNGTDIPQASVDLINRSLNINGLMPKKYTLEIGAPGYQTWKKETSVHSGIATEYWNIVLVPNEPVKRKAITEGSLYKYAYSPDEKKLAYFVRQDEFLSLFVKDSGGEHFVYKESLNQRFAPNGSELKWSPDSAKLIFSFRKDDQEDIYLLLAQGNFDEIYPVGESWKKEIASDEAPGSIPSPSKNPSGGTIKISSYSWADKDNLHFLAGEKIYLQPVEGLVNPESQLTPEVISEDVLGYTLCDNLVCVVDKTKKTLEFLSDVKVSEASVALPENFKLTDGYQVYAYGKKGVAILDNEGNLFLWDKEGGKKSGQDIFKYVFSEVKEAYFSDDGKKLLFNTKNEVYVYFIQEWEVQPKHAAGELEKIYSQEAEIRKVQWFTDYQNVFVANANEIKFVELDGRGGRNVSVFILEKEGEISNASYDAPEKKLRFMQVISGENKELAEISFPAAQGIFSGMISNNENQ
ncbi:MAG: hypothetical protein FJZ04_03675 [Candidatus Moranbacteria bacterium]|nr:hypothetical protein [Candidatus Moranbacteria bacterium]